MRHLAFLFGSTADRELRVIPRSYKTGEKSHPRRDKCGPRRGPLCLGTTLVCDAALGSHEWQPRVDIGFPADEVAATNDPGSGTRDHRRIVGAIGECRIGDRHVRSA